MKKILLLFCSFYYAIAFAQQAPPQGINYQAMVYAPYCNQQAGVNNAGQLPANTKQAVVKFTLEEGQNGPVIYEETHIDTTDQYGLLSTVIGTGTPTSSSPGLFNQIDWSLGDPYLRVSITLTQYSSTVTSYQKLWSVPYALYAGKAHMADSANYANASGYSDYANTAGNANTANYATTSGYADSSGFAVQAGSSYYADSANYSNNSGYSDTSGYSYQSGNGIVGIIDNGNGTLTLQYLNGSTITTGVLTGLTGPQGPAGQSAYEVWLSNGNSGSLQDYLNSL
jgi:hypothetical protein